MPIRWQHAALMLAITAVAGPVRAQQGAAVVVLAGSADDRLASNVEAAAARRGFAFVDRRAKPQAPSPIPSIVGRAIDAYQGFRYPEAVRLLDRAVDALGRGDALRVPTQVIADVFVYRGLARVAVGDADGAWPEFIQAATLAPTRVLDPVRFPPSAVESFERARAEVVKAERARVGFKLPAKATCEVWADGRELRAASVSLSRGIHFYAVRCGSRRAGGRIEIVSNMEIEPALSPEPERTVESAAALARSRGADIAVFVELTGGQPPTARVVAVDLKTRARRRRVVSGTAYAINVAIGQAIERSQPVVDKTVAREQTRWYQKPWVWAIAGAAVAAAVILPLTTGDDSSSSFRVAPTGSLP
ncbi:MAG: hypothetical protein KJO07_10145 [Deltaproteobacteria bacterium]|nr:hypothetical protein [Deltaproteobacteria bacterium]